MRLLKRKTAVFSVLLFALWVLFCPGVVTAAKKVKTVKTVKKGVPHLVVAPLTFEAGKVIEGKEVSHTFVIKNQGNATLIIKQVKPG